MPTSRLIRQSGSFPTNPSDGSDFSSGMFCHHFSLWWMVRQFKLQHFEKEGTQKVVHRYICQNASGVSRLELLLFLCSAANSPEWDTCVEPLASSACHLFVRARVASSVFTAYRRHRCRAACSELTSRPSVSAANQWDVSGGERRPRPSDSLCRPWSKYGGARLFDFPLVVLRMVTRGRCAGGVFDSSVVVCARSGILFCSRLNLTEGNLGFSLFAGLSPKSKSGGRLRRSVLDPVWRK